MALGTVAGCIAVRRTQTGGQGTEHRAIDRHRHDTLHSLHSLCAFWRGSRRLAELAPPGGESVEIGNYVAHSVGSELSGNVIDLCPVGALTAKPSRYRVVWGIRAASIAPHDSVRSISLFTLLRGQVVRVVPARNGQSTKPGFSIMTDSAMKAFYSDDRLVRPGWGEEADWK